MSDFKIQNPDYEAHIREIFDAAPFIQYIGAELASIEPGYCEIHLPYKDALMQQNGFYHAGVLGTIADHAGGCAAATLMPPDTAVLTVEYKLNLLAPATGEKIIARAQVIRAGRTVTVCRTDVFSVNQEKEKFRACPSTKRLFRRYRPPSVFFSNHPQHLLAQCLQYPPETVFPAYCHSDKSTSFPACKSVPFRWRCRVNRLRPHV